MTIGPGVRLGRYRVDAAVGAGGMGEVYKAHDTVLGRDVAIKVLPERLVTDADARLRFEREATLLAALSHPNILSIHDFGEDHGALFAVMELLQGQTLRRRLADGPLEAGAAIRIALDVARGLAAAHARGIVHRDLKPENVFLPADGPVRILDFGIARVHDAYGSPEAITIAGTSAVTRPGMVIGTVTYMSPEQLRGEAAEPRSDIFSLGIVLYEMLAGRQPFAAGSEADVIGRILRDPPPPMTGVAAGLQSVVLRCLEKRPAARYASARDLAVALEDLQSGAVGSGRTASAVGTGSIRHLPGSIAVLPFADMSAQKTFDYLCEGIAEEILTALTKVEGLRVVARSSAFRFKGGSDDVRTIAQHLGVESVLEGSVRAAGDRLRVVAQLVDASDGYQLWSERFDRTLDDVFAVQDEIAGAVASTLRVHLRGASGVSPVAAAPREPEAYARYLKGRYHWNRRTEADLRRSVEHFEAALAHDPSYAEAHAGIGEAYATLGIYGALAPREAMPKARAAAERALALKRSLPGALATLGCVHALYDWSWGDAEREFRRAIEVMPASASARPWYALNQLVPLGRFREADLELGLALEIDPLSLPVSTGLGVSRYYAHRYEDAIRELHKPLELDPGFALARYFLALAFAEAGATTDARREIEAAIRLSGGSPEMTAAAGYVRARSGDVDGARATADELIALSSARYVSPGLVAWVYAGLGDGDAAVTWLHRAADVRSADLAWLGVRPIVDGLRADARFQALCARIGLLAE